MVLMHNRFWKIAETFTGLKLKGEIAKFGQIELSDVTAFYIFPDEKVLSGTEYGKLLLWEGNMIKAVISIDEETPCHRGPIEAIFLEGEYIVTAGGDGSIRFWNFQAINEAEGDDQLNFYLAPTNAYQIKSGEGKNANILTIERGTDKWLLFDTNGYIWKLTLPNLDQELVMETNSGKLMDLAVSNRINAAVTIGEDGAVRLWDFVAKRELYHQTFNGKGTCVDWVTQNQAYRGRIIYTGFSTGVVRVLLLSKNDFVLLKAIRVFRDPVYRLKVSPDGKTLLVSTLKGDIFFLELDITNPKKIEPYCLLELGYQINDICWHEDSTKILMACEDGRVREMVVPRKEECDYSESFLRDPESVTIRSYTIKMMEFQKPKLDEYEEFLLARKEGAKAIKEKLEEEWEPAPILAVTYLDVEGKQFVCSVDGKYLGYYYICQFGGDRPLQAIPSTNIPARFLKFFNGYTTLVAGQDNGTFVVNK